MLTKRLPLLIALVLAAAALIARLLPGPRTIDDAFITFRYSANLLDGLGFVYNPGIFTLGTTTPLWAFVMAAIGWVTGGRDFPMYAVVVSALADAISAVSIYFIMRKLTGRDLVAVIPAAAWTIAPQSVTFAIGGMETSLAILWGLLAFTLVLYRPPSRRWPEIVLGVIVALALLTRIDSAIWIGPLLLAHWWIYAQARRDRPLLRRIPWAAWLTSAAIVLPFMLAAWAYFGSPIPNSVTAKREAYVLEPNAALIRMVQAYATPFSEFDAFGGMGAFVGAVVYALLFGVGLIAAGRKHPVALALFAYPVLYLIAFSTLIDLVFRWYLAPPLPYWMMALTLGAWAALRPLAIHEHAAPRRAAAVVMSAIGALWLGMTMTAWTPRPDHGPVGWPERPAPLMAWHEIELLYVQAGRFLVDERGITPATRVAAGDIGAIGFTTRAVIVDTIGLVTPENTAYYPVDPALIVADQNYAIPPQLIRDRQPEYLVTMEAFIRLGLARDPWFTANYSLILEYPTDFYGTGMQVWAKAEVMSDE